MLRDFLRYIRIRTLCHGPWRSKYSHTNFKTHRGERPNTTNVDSCRRFEETFESTQWGKVKQMQPMLLRIYSGRQFETIWMLTVERSQKCNRCDFTPIKADDLRNHLKIPPRHILIVIRVANTLFLTVRWERTPHSGEKSFQQSEDNNWGGCQYWSPPPPLRDFGIH